MLKAGSGAAARMSSGMVSLARICRRYLIAYGYVAPKTSSRTIHPRDDILIACGYVARRSPGMVSLRGLVRNRLGEARRAWPSAIPLIRLRRGALWRSRQESAAAGRLRLSAPRQRERRGERCVHPHLTAESWPGAAGVALPATPVCYKREKGYRNAPALSP